jgi:hypothetical protein
MTLALKLYKKMALLFKRCILKYTGQGDIFGFYFIKDFFFIKNR